MRPVPIRAHHGLCFLFYEGIGYDAHFVKQMTAVQQQLQKNPLVILRQSCDCVCAACPNQQARVCMDANEVRRLDQHVLALCGLTAETILPWEVFTQRVMESILLPGKRAAVCGRCRWEAICAAKEQQLILSYRHTSLQNKRPKVSV